MSRSFNAMFTVALVAGLFAGARATRAETTLGAPEVRGPELRGPQLRAPQLREVLAAAVTLSGARVDIVALDSAAGDCITTGPQGRAEVPRPIDGSSRVAVKLTGARFSGAACEAWAWARVRVFAPVAVTQRPIRAGESLAAAIRIEEREIKPGHVPAVVSEGSVSDRALGAGQMIEADVVRAPGPRPGEMVKVVIVAGALAIEQPGRVVSCGRTTICAVLPTGKHVEGTIVDGRLMVRTP